MREKKQCIEIYNMDMLRNLLHIIEFEFKLSFGLQKFFFMIKLIFLLLSEIKDVEKKFVFRSIFTN